MTQPAPSYWLLSTTNGVPEVPCLIYAAIFQQFRLPLESDRHNILPMSIRDLFKLLHNGLCDGKGLSVTG